MIFSYSRILVALQFFIIFLFLLLNNSIFNYPFSLLVFFCGLLFGFYTLYFNRLGNFNITPDIKENSKLITHGPYKYIRHPMYLSVLLMMLGIFLTDINMINLILFSSLILILYLKAKKEEILWNQKTKEYNSYKKKTRMFIPFIL